MEIKLLQVVMFLIIGGFILIIISIDVLLRSHKVKIEIRHRVSKCDFMVAIYVHVLLIIILIIEKLNR